MRFVFRMLTAIGMLVGLGLLGLLLFRWYKDPTRPTPGDPAWMPRHLAINERVRRGDVRLIFLGDSITEDWDRAGKDVWKEVYEPRKAANLGVRGSRTQHVLWRLDHGNLDGIAPAAAVILIGTNNLDDNSPEGIRDGVRQVLGRLRARFPKIRILVMGIFPRDREPGTVRRRAIVRTNELLEQLADGRTLEYLDIGHSFLTAEGRLKQDLMPDLLHLSPQGYRIWADAIEDRVARMLGEKN